MASFKIRLTLSAEQELRAAPFPFRRQIVQALYKLKQHPRPPACEPAGLEEIRFRVHGWSIVYGIDDGAGVITVYRIHR